MEERWTKGLWSLIAKPGMTQCSTEALRDASCRLSLTKLTGLCLLKFEVIFLLEELETYGE